MSVRFSVALAFWGADVSSGEHRLPACPFGSLPKSSWNVHTDEFLRRSVVVGKLSTTTGWQPVLPRDQRRARYLDRTRGVRYATGHRISH